MKKRVVTIVGPTAVGKTDLSIEIAKQFNGEIINGDAMQVYKGMDIGTAKIKNKEMQGIKHYLLDMFHPNESYTAADFKYYVKKYVNEITKKSKVPIIVGGSGLYIESALFNFTFTDSKRDPSITKKLESIVKEKGIQPLYDRLKRIDPKQAEKIHPNNHRRIIRALEVYETTGKPMSLHHEKDKKTPLYNAIIIGLEMERSLLYKKIDDRCDKMIEEGLLEEVQKLYDLGYENEPAMKAIGYKEFIPYIKQEQSLATSIQLFKRNSRRYAKRQYTWFKNKLDIKWYSITPNTKYTTFRTILKDLAGVLGDK